MEDRASTDQQSAAKLPAAEKKRLRRKKAKEDKKAIKVVNQQLHAELHIAQEKEAERQLPRKKQADKHEHVVEVDGDGGSVVVEYVAEPLGALDELRAAVDKAAVEDNPYEGIGGLQVSNEDNKDVAALTELDRIAKHFLPKSEEEEGSGTVDVTAEVPIVTDDKPEEQQDTEGADDEQDKSNRELKREKNEQTSQMIAHLKKECPRPEVVEVWDIRARDPKLLVFLKAYRNTVPVPRHWSQKRKYLQGKRGIEKAPFELPSYIQETGIADMRNALAEQVQEKLKSKGKQRMRPKMGKMDIDYGLMQDAFFKRQTKPKMSHIGDLYYEGKEYEMKASKAFPGILSPELKEALGMSELSPPPWLINMQRYGPPPSYPSLKIPGLNAPIPPGTEFGYQPGGWGKPPVDQEGRPLYGDVFGVNHEPNDDLDHEDKTRRWGELENDDISSDEESSEDEEEQNLTQEQLEQGIASGMMTGLASSMDAGIETNASLELRKTGGMSTGGPTPSLYTVLEQQEAAGVEGLTAVGHTYKVPGGQRPAPGNRKRPGFMQSDQAGSVDVALDPEELERLGEQGLQQLYQQEAGGHRREDMSDMVANNAAARKRKNQEQASRTQTKKSKDDFKF